MDERIAVAVWIAIALICVFAALHFLQPDPEQDICGQQTKYSYEVDGKRYSMPYEAINGQDVVEGDIVIGRSDGPGYFPPTVVPKFVNKKQATRWGENVAPYVVPYVIDSSASSYGQLIKDAMSLWANVARLEFRELSGTRDWTKENYVKFISGSACQSNSLGIKEKEPGKGEDDNINVVEVAGCGSYGNIAHEIGHVLGLGHEQSRSDRGDYITIKWRNIKDKVDGDPKHINDYRKHYCRVIWNQETMPNTTYDFDSIMHYSVYSFAKESTDDSCEKVEYKKEKQCLAFVPKPDKLRLWPETLVIGQRDHLSLGDIAAVKTLYPDPPPPTLTSPEPPVPIDQSCDTTTTTTVEGRTTTTTKPCRPNVVVVPPQDRPDCRSDICSPVVRVSRPRPDRWRRPGWCRPWPRPRLRLCGGWIEDHWGPPPFDD